MRVCRGCSSRRLGVQRAAMDRSLTRLLRAIAARKKQFAETNFSNFLEADMFNSITKLRFTLAVLVIAALTIAIYKAGSTQASATADTQSLIGHLLDDPAPVLNGKIT